MSQTQEKTEVQTQEPLVFQLRELVRQELGSAYYAQSTQSSCGGEDDLYDDLS